MPLINCPECSSQVSDKATNCPMCGYPLQTSTINLNTPQSPTMVDSKKKTSKIRNVLKWVLVAFILITFFRVYSRSTDGSRTSSSAPSYSSSDNVQYEIAKAFAANKMTGCGEFTWTANPGQDSEYTVKCSSDGQSWTTYTVWTKTERVVSGTVP